MEKGVAIRPELVIAAKKAACALPPEVFDVWNGAIIKAWTGSNAILYQTKMANLIAATLNISRNDVYAKHYLDIEEVYRAQGWDVHYDRPAYCETYEPSFTFTKK